MSHTFTSIDTTTLPAAMLALAKSHLRVDVDEDDALITEYLTWAISYAENFWGLQIFGAEVDFIPDGGEARYASPVQPVSAFTAADADDVDVSAEYAMTSAGLAEPVWFARVDEDVFPADITFSLTTGYTALADMNPAMRGGILRIAATMYEHRETVTTAVDQVPYWLNDMLGGLWVPRA